jgi:tRNA(Ile)-lysidine synthase
MGPHPAVAEVRLAVRRCLSGAGLAPGDLVLVACSGGADSLALAAALAFEAPRLGLRGGGVTVDHGLQPGSADQAQRVTKILAAMDLDPVRSISVTVARPGARRDRGGRGAPGERGAGSERGDRGGPSDQDDPGDRGEHGDAGGRGAGGGRGDRGRGGESGDWGGRGSGDYPGPEGAAREARYRALDQAASSCGAAVILLGHTTDDQAETVLLGLARGSGTRSLAGMPERNGRCLRPLLEISRATTRAACAALGLEPWDDPQNADPSFARARVRQRLLPALEEELGPGVTEALARSARQLRADAEFLDSLAKAEAHRLAPSGGGLPLEALAELPQAIRSRVLRDAATAAGCPPGALTARHIAGLEALVTGWRGQRWTDLPGGIRGRRRYGKLQFSSSNGEAAGGRE